MVEKDLGTLSQTLLRKLLERSFLRTFKNFKQGDFRSLLFVCADFGVAVFRATISGCSEPHSASEMRTFSLSPLPDRSGRKLVDDWDGTISFYGEFRFIPPHQSLTRQTACSFLPPKGKPFCKITFALHDKATRANRKGKPQLKDIFDISSMYATFAVFAQRKEGFPLGGKKTASSLSRKRLVRADRKGNPQCKAIFAMFAQRTEGFPFGGSCRVSD